jgi:membrane protein implicated in regulation of membrane protease activity
MSIAPHYGASREHRARLQAAGVGHSLAPVDADIITLIWLAVGLFLVGVELVVPGLVVIFLGMGALLTAALRWLGLIEGMPASVITFVVASVAFVLGLRSTVKKWFPPEESVHDDDEVMRAYGTVVDVLEDVSELGDEKPGGRIRFEGTSWPAGTTTGVIPKGSKARLVVRKDLAWLVEPAAAALEAPGEETVPAERVGERKDGEEG